MVRKGNLLYNGDFEKGDTTGWTVAPKNSTFGKANIQVDDANQKSGSYCGKVIAPSSGYQAIGYDMEFDFEEYVGYQYGFWAKKGSAWGLYPFIEIYDDNDELLDYFWLAQRDNSEYEYFTGIFTNWANGRYARLFLGMYGLNEGDACYYDNVRVVGLKNIKDWTLNMYKDMGTLTIDTTWNLNLVIPRKAVIRDKAKVSDMSGTNPTLDIDIRVFDPCAGQLIEDKAFSQITANGDYYLTFETVSFGLISIRHDLGGDSPSFKVRHYLEVCLT